MHKDVAAGAPEWAAVAFAQADLALVVAEEQLGPAVARTLKGVEVKRVDEVPVDEDRLCGGVRRGVVVRLLSREGGPHSR